MFPKGVVATAVFTHGIFLLIAQKFYLSFCATFASKFVQKSANFSNRVKIVVVKSL